MAAEPSRTAVSLVIVHRGTRSDADVHAMALRLVEATAPKPRAARTRIPATPAQERLARARMRVKVKGTVKMRALVLNALTGIRKRVEQAVGMREQGFGDDAVRAKIEAALLALKGLDGAEFFEPIEDLVTELVVGGAESAASELALKFDVVPERAIEAILHQELAFSREFVGRERAGLQRLLADSLREQVPMTELTSRISEFFDDGIHYVKPDGAIERVVPADSWAETVARTEVSRAYNAGHMAVYTEIGTKRVRWIGAEDERECGICMELNDTVVELGDEFAPGIVMPPDPHPGCRCSSVDAGDEPVTNGDGENDS